MVGVSHQAGLGVEKDLSKAQSYYKFAADAGLASALNYLGLIESNGLINGPENKNEEEAFDFFSDAAQ